MPPDPVTNGKGQNMDDYLKPICRYFYNGQPMVLPVGVHKSRCQIQGGSLRAFDEIIHGMLTTLRMMV